jgi:hypothetical protein
MKWTYHIHNIWFIIIKLLIYYSCSICSYNQNDTSMYFLFFFSTTLLYVTIAELLRSRGGFSNTCVLCAEPIMFFNYNNIDCITCRCFVFTFDAFSYRQIVRSSLVWQTLLVARQSSHMVRLRQWFSTFFMLPSLLEA